MLPEVGPLRAANEPFVVFEVQGEPNSWKRSRAAIRYTKANTPYIHFFVDAETANYRDAIAWCCKSALHGKPPSERPLAVIAHAFFQIPASWSMREKINARNGAKLPTGVPDGDNVLKIIGDALNEICWHDDSQIVDARVLKRYSDRPGLRVEVREMK